jgi:hypothetical protein
VTGRARLIPAATQRRAACFPRERANRLRFGRLFRASDGKFGPSLSIA